MTAAKDLMRKHIPPSTAIEVRRRGQPTNWFQVKFTLQKAVAEDADEAYRLRQCGPLTELTGYMVGEELDKEISKIYVPREQLERKDQDKDSPTRTRKDFFLDFCSIRVPSAHYRIIDEQLYNGCISHAFPPIAERARRLAIAEKITELDNKAFLAVNNLVIIGGLNWRDDKDVGYSCSTIGTTRSLIVIPIYDTNDQFLRQRGLGWSEPSLSEKIFGEIEPSSLETRVFPLSDMPTWELKEHTLDECLTWNNKFLRLCAYDYDKKCRGQRVVLEALRTVLKLKDRMKVLVTKINDINPQISSWDVSNNAVDIFLKTGDRTDRSVCDHLRSLIVAAATEKTNGNLIRQAVLDYSKQIDAWCEQILAKVVEADQWKKFFTEENK